MSPDIRYMQHALHLARRGLGQTWPNPSVGALVVKDGQIIGHGVTARGGRPHAEPQALQEAGKDARGATLYVTLEPCSHRGKTGPCAEAILAAGITRVVVACRDSNPLVSGRGISMLQAAGLEVTEGIGEAEARALNEGFFCVIERQRPFIAVKTATSLDGRTATRTGESQWITGSAARLRGHLLRADYDAILTGIGTLLADNPALTCRIPGREADSPVRVIVDSSLRTPPKARALPAWIMTSEKALTQKTSAAEQLKHAGATLFAVPEDERGLSLTAIAQTLAGQGITRLLVEAGKRLTESFLISGLTDRIYWFRAPMVIGEVSSLVTAPCFAASHIESVGADRLEIYDSRKF